MAMDLFLATGEPTPGASEDGGALRKSGKYQSPVLTDGPAEGSVDPHLPRCS